jgi:hypothetical protein
VIRELFERSARAMEPAKQQEGCKQVAHSPFSMLGGDAMR